MSSKFLNIVICLMVGFILVFAGIKFENYRYNYNNSNTSSTAPSAGSGTEPTQPEM